MPISKPETCRGCVLESTGAGYAPAIGPRDGDFLMVGEAPDWIEANRGEPLLAGGPDGEMFSKLLRRVGLERPAVRLDNVLRCRPPNGWVVGAPWEYSAVARCSQEYLTQSLNEPHRAIVALGPSATRRLLGLPGKGHKQENWHGCPTVGTNGQLVIPTYHPSFIRIGNQKLIGTVCWDLQVAQQVARGEWQREDAELTVDPPAEWFRDWAKVYLLSSNLEGGQIWLSVDIETVRKSGRDEGDLEDVAGDEITRINFAYHPDHGITVPFAGQYLDTIRELLESNGPKCFWNARYDVPRLRVAGCPIKGPVLDFMWAWHVLQSDLPRGLGFVAPFYSRYGAWKHLSGTDPGRYAAIDAIQTLRCAFGIAKDLQAQGSWDVFYRHVYQLDTRVLHPAEEIGLLVDREELNGFQERLTAESNRLEVEIQNLVPDQLRPRSIWKRDPGDEAGAVQTIQKELVQCCRVCGATQVAKTHRCKQRELVPKVELLEADVPRWIRLEPFNPASPQQLLQYIEWKGQKGGRAKKSKTDQASTDSKVLQGLAKSTKDPFYGLVLTYRGIEKIRGTYVEGTAQRLGAVWDAERGVYIFPPGCDFRLHPQFLNVPSTGRLSCVSPNLQNVTQDREGSKGTVAAGFRRCLVAAPGCALVEVDYSAIEAVLSGWFMGDPNFIRLAKLGIHDYHAGYVIGKPANLKWSDADLLAHFAQTKAWLKKQGSIQRDKSKRTIYGTLYGMSAYGLHQTYPELFPSVKAAQENQALLFRVCPKLQSWQQNIKDRAYKQGFLGGSDHPYHYKHWFWLVYAFNSSRGRIDGEDAKRCVAYYPQSTAAGVIKDAALRAAWVEAGGEDYIGDLYYGKTPLRALVHDSILAEVPLASVERAVEVLVRNMTRPIKQLPCPAEWGLGEYLTIGVEAKVGKNWLEMEVRT